MRQFDLGIPDDVDPAASREQRTKTPPLKTLLAVGDHLRDVPISRAGLTTLTSNGLLRNGVRALGDLDGISVETLTRFHRFGTKCISEILAHVSTVPPSPEPEPAPELPHDIPSCSARFSGLPVEALGVRARSIEFLRQRGYDTLGALCAAPSGVLAQVPDAAERFRSLLDGAYDPTLVSADSLDDELAVLLARCGLRDPARDQTILELTCGLAHDEPLTLDAAGKRLGLTRERVQPASGACGGAAPLVVALVAAPQHQRSTACVGRATWFGPARGSDPRWWQNSLAAPL